MRGVANSIRRAIAVTSAFKSTLVEAENSRHGTNTEEFYGRKTLNLGGLDVPLIEGELKSIEKTFLKAAANGDATSVKRLIENAKNYQLNVNCMDTMGRGVLRIAIEAEHIELLQMLLGYEQIELRDCLLHAINEEDVQAVELILQAQSERLHKKNLKQGLEGLLGHIESSSFTPDITPLILAAHRDNYIIIKLLLNRGNQIAKPHEPRCACNACVQANREDSLQYSKHRINAYKALASPCFISLSSNDPILTAFELSSELNRLGDLENEFREDYEQLSVKCQEFATALLEQTRGSAELAIVLNYHTGSSDGYDEDAIYMPCGADGQRMKLSRLKLAIKYKQKKVYFGVLKPRLMLCCFDYVKTACWDSRTPSYNQISYTSKFVAHPHCQQLLASLWYEGLPGFRRRHVAVQAGTIIIICMLFPFLCICYLIAPESRIGNMLHKPFIKFLCQSSAYTLFLALLILVAIRIEYVLTDAIEDRMSRRDPPASVIECIVIIFIFGFVWQQITRIWKIGLRAYAMDMWHLLDFVQNSLYMCTIALRGVAIMRVRLYKEPAVLNRAQWSAYDPVLISECLFAIANIFATLRLIYVFTVSPQLGPLQISLGRMANDILKFFCVFSLVIVAFAFGFNQLYWFYANTRFDRCKDVPFSLKEGEREVYEYCKTTGRYFTNLFEIVQTLYWSAYGLIELTSLDLEYPHVFTEFVGKLIFGAYCCIAFIVLLNMLIAMMNNSYQQIAEQADTEWKFARSKLWISYFDDAEILPVPFNLIPGRSTLQMLLEKCRCCKRENNEEDSQAEWHTVKGKVLKANEREERYLAVMRELVNRYLVQKQMSSNGQGVTEDDLNEIKGDISAFRFELLDILQANGMKINPDELVRKGNKLRRKGSRRGLIHSWKPDDFHLESLDKTESYEAAVSTPPSEVRGQPEDGEPQPSLAANLPLQKSVTATDTSLGAATNLGFVGDTPEVPPSVLSEFPHTEPETQFQLASSVGDVRQRRLPDAGIEYTENTEKDNASPESPEAVSLQTTLAHGLAGGTEIGTKETLAERSTAHKGLEGPQHADAWVSERHADSQMVQTSNGKFVSAYCGPEEAGYVRCLSYVSYDTQEGPNKSNMVQQMVERKDVQQPQSRRQETDLRDSFSSYDSVPRADFV